MNIPLDPRALAIVREARHQFVSEGFAATRIEPIAREASVSTATLYTFFESKSALFQAVIQQTADEFSTRLAAVRMESPPSREALINYMIKYTEFLADPFVRKMFRLVLAERPRFHELAAEFFDKGRGDIAHQLIIMLNELEAAGVVQFQKASWVSSQLLGMVEHPVLLLPLAMGKDPVLSRTAAEIATDAVTTIWARYGT